MRRWSRRALCARLETRKPGLGLDPSHSDKSSASADFFSSLPGTPRAHGYVAANWAVRGLTKSVALELASQAVRVNSVHPGLIKTPLTEHLPDDLIPIPLGRPGKPEEVELRAVPRERRIVVRHRHRVRGRRRDRAGDPHKS